MVFDPIELWLWESGKNLTEDLKETLKNDNKQEFIAVNK